MEYVIFSHNGALKEASILEQSALVYKTYLMPNFTSHCQTPKCIFKCWSVFYTPSSFNTKLVKYKEKSLQKTYFLYVLLTIKII